MYIFVSIFAVATMIHNEWQREPHGRRAQRKAIVFILKELELYDSFGVDNPPSMETIYRSCNAMECRDVNIRTLRRWWETYLEWGELPYYEKKRKAAMAGYHKNTVVDEHELLKLKSIVDKNPNNYLDDIALIFGIETGKFVHPSTIWRYMTERLSYSQQVLETLAKQQCVEDEHRFKLALALLLQGCPERLVTVDETHKDRNAARRRRGWARRNSGGLQTREWFLSEVRYTLLAAADIGGFVASACHTVMRDELSDEGAAGTVDGDYFLYWVKEYLVPTLGRYELGEPRSVVMMDNASTHMSDEIQAAIENAGAVLIYGAPFSPHLNPIELYFGVYKKYIKRNGERMKANWYEVHIEALSQVDGDKAMNFFRKSEIPGV